MEVIILVVGKVCSGKSTYASRFNDHFTRIDVGDIVRKITKQEERVFNPNLNNEIVDELHEQIYEQFANKYCQGIVITGFRQKNIIHSLMCWYKESVPMRIIHLDAPDEELKQRYNKRAAAKDLKLSFEEVVERDNKLGYQEMIDSIYKNYEPFKLKH